MCVHAKSTESICVVAWRNVCECQVYWVNLSSHLALSVRACQLPSLLSQFESIIEWPMLATCFSSSLAHIGRNGPRKSGRHSLDAVLTCRTWRPFSSARGFLNSSLYRIVSFHANGSGGRILYLAREITVVGPITRHVTLSGKQIFSCSPPRSQWTFVPATWPTTDRPSTRGPAYSNSSPLPLPGYGYDVSREKTFGEF